MKLLQIKVDDKLKEAIDSKSAMYGVPASSLIKIILVKTFMKGTKNAVREGNIFNSERDNKSMGIPLDTLIEAL